jgi:hypothetical protein
MSELGFVKKGDRSGVQSQIVVVKINAIATCLTPAAPRDAVSLLPSREGIR